MPFIPHTDEDIRAMLATAGVPDIETLFDEIPADLRTTDFDAVPPGLNEMEVSRLLQERAAQNRPTVCFAGGGAYQHHIPAAVWEITSRGEYYSAYTPYQAEASQGTLQVIYEYQSMMTALTGMEVSNASIYDGASALGEAVLMAVRLSRRGKSSCVLLPATVHPAYRQVVATLVGDQGISLQEISYDFGSGVVEPETLESIQKDFAALVIPQPNYFGCLEEVDTLTNWAHERGALVIGVVNPTSLALLKPPGEWGEAGADIVCGEGQPLGIPLASGGPYFGFMACKQAHVRQLPGRIVGRTVDLESKPGYTLTLQAREQHIRRSKATSNICTNQGLMVTAATLYMALLGPQGLAQVATACHANTMALVKRLTALPGVEQVFEKPFFHEAVLRFPVPASRVLSVLGQGGVLAGVKLEQAYPELNDTLLVCATELRNEEDIEFYVRELTAALAG
ncbi:aminomethyl-transferring glycine dehydrogenase subunit GcvPA [Nitrosococcus oceani]|uniref:Probable glycine dehydrogenase (decarboxylating) subunit 1 n=2 Tax=Nitrosococcus oceani TaxID=1229 RepID=Q3JCM6_NITOC|nr:aminomethyl-transferring glycine dehydrogenase subunit GcvPA [Nitrosococcus oceani]KFI20193.1 glycine dehydrogenase [Nitrosococcus oceani C-27]ABA57420.1 glycine dehydrogenase (decarboxylating) alpha subunit [Nitrosococcus oceani ATCC 19707]EDZ67096.1 Glycine cleavage system P-protein [Nitrosococcus oceani AFC27]KFI23495.1 glycine dehydrogenase [Nitrosococcus oceani]GEM21572.1 glycine dehydrogenase [Nitrosococcus oceani]